MHLRRSCVVLRRERLAPPLRLIQAMERQEALSADSVQPDWRHIVRSLVCLRQAMDNWSAYPGRRSTTGNKARHARGQRNSRVSRPCETSVLATSRRAWPCGSATLIERSARRLWRTAANEGGLNANRQASLPRPSRLSFPRAPRTESGPKPEGHAENRTHNLIILTKANAPKNTSSSCARPPRSAGQARTRAAVSPGGIRGSRVGLRLACHRR